MPNLISVIIPVFNGEQYLRRCLDSILSNTYKYLEIICINDGSTDNSLQILMEYKNVDNRIIIINQKNKGLSAARNAGLSIASGDYIAFIDSDDWVHRLYFEILLQYSKKYEADICACKALRVSEMVEDNEFNKTLDIKVVKGNKARNDRDLSWGRVWGRLFNRKSIKCLKFVKVVIEDKAFTTDVLSNSSNNFVGVIINEPLYYYYKREGSLVTKITASANLQLCYYCIHRRNHIMSKTKYVYTREAVHAYLAYQYGIPKTQNRNIEGKKYLYKVKKYLIKAVLADSGFGLIEKIYLLLLLIFPYLYCFYQIYLMHFAPLLFRVIFRVVKKNK